MRSKIRSLTVVGGSTFIRLSASVIATALGIKARNVANLEAA